MTTTTTTTSERFISSRRARNYTAKEIPLPYAAHTNFDKNADLSGFAGGGRGNMRGGLVGRILGESREGVGRGRRERRVETSRRGEGRISNVGKRIPPLTSKAQGWSAVSSSLEPSPPTGHYCLVPYSVTNCFIKLKSHNPHSVPRHDPAPTLPSLPPPLRSLRFSRPLVYTRPHATSDRVRPPCLVRLQVVSPFRSSPLTGLSFSISPENFVEPFFSDLIKRSRSRPRG